MMCFSVSDPRLLSEMVRDPVLDVRLWVLPHPRPPGILRKYLLQARAIGVRQILLFNAVSTSHETLFMAKELGMLAVPYSWLMLNLVSTFRFIA